MHALAPEHHCPRGRPVPGQTPAHWWQRTTATHPPSPTRHTSVTFLGMLYFGHTGIQTFLYAIHYWLIVAEVIQGIGQKLGD